MQALDSLQRQFASALSDAAMATVVAPVFVGDAGSVIRRLAIYRGNAQANAIKALTAAFPIVQKIVGAEFFEGLAREFAKRSPSRSGDLNEFGAGFADFLSSFEHVRNLPYLPDVARMEWLLHRAHYAADGGTVDPVALASIAPEQQTHLRFALHPAAGLIESAYPLCKIWEIHQPGYTDEMQIEPVAGRQYVLVRRPHFRAEVVAIDAGTFAFLGALSRDQALESALQLALNATLAANSKFDLGIALHEFIGSRVIVAFNLPGA